MAGLMAASPTAIAGVRPRVLIAEDQPDIIEAIRMALKPEGFDTHAVQSPKAALEALAADRFDLLLMDLNYTRDTTSGMEGLDLLNQVLQRDRQLPVIVMTAWGSVELAVEAMRRGAADFIQKPWDNWRLIGLVRNQMARREQLRAAENEHERDLREAGELQQRLLPKHITQFSGLDIAADWKPARTIGGDYFDVLRFPDGSVGLCIADVEGKGVAAALVMSNLQSAVKAFATPKTEPMDLCERLNRIFFENVQAERSIGFVYAHVDPATRRLKYANAGHWPPLLIRRDGTTERLDVGGVLLGRLPGRQYAQAELTLQSGDFLLLFTDGLTEAENANEEPFGEARIVDCVRGFGKGDAYSLQRSVLARATEHCHDHFHDDATLMVVGVE